MKKSKKIIILLTIITSLIALISANYNYLLQKYISYKFNINLKEAASIGIIGGADGPTSIFIASKPHSNAITIISTFLSIIGFVYLFSGSFYFLNIKKPPK